MLSNTPC